jgi:hypothetical protein
VYLLSQEFSSTEREVAYKSYEICGKLTKKNADQKTYLRGDDIFERDLKETGYEGMDRIQLPQDTNL